MLIEDSPEFNSFRLPFIHSISGLVIFGLFNEVIRLFYYLEHRCRIGVSDLVCMKFYQEEVYIL